LDYKPGKGLGRVKKESKGEGDGLKEHGAEEGEGSENTSACKHFWSQPSTLTASKLATSEKRERCFRLLSDAKKKLILAV